MEKDKEKMVVVGTSSTHVDGIVMCDDLMDYDIEVRGTSGLKELKEMVSPHVTQPWKSVRFVVPKSSRIGEDAKQKLENLMEAREAGIAYIVGHAHVCEKRGSNVIKKLTVNFCYDFLSRNCREVAYPVSVPHATSLGGITTQLWKISYG